MADRKLSGLGAAVQAFSELAYVLMPPRLGTTTGNPDAIASSARDAGGLIVIWMDECVGIGKNASEFFWTFDVAEERCTARKMRCAEYLPAWALNSVARNEQPVIPPCVPGKSGENVEQHGPAIMGYIAYHGMDLSAGITHRFHGLGGLCRVAQVIFSILYLRDSIPGGRNSTRVFGFAVNSASAGPNTLCLIWTCRAYACYRGIITFDLSSAGI